MDNSNLKLSDLYVGLCREIHIDLTPDHIERFAELSGDVSPLHTNPTFAKSLGFPAPIAHGALIIAFVSNLIGNHLPGAFGILHTIELSFRRPVTAPETLRIEGKVSHISKSTGQVTIDVSVTGSAGLLMATGKAKSIVRG